MSVPILTSPEAVAAARAVADRLAEGDRERDQARVLPYQEMKALAATGLLAITVPAAYGGPELPYATLAEVVRLLSWGDPNVGQIPHSHFVFLNQLRLQGAPEHQRRIYAEVLAGASVANAQAEFGTKHVREFRTTLYPDGQGRWRLTGEKFYCTGSLFADYLAVLAHLDVDGPLVVAWVRADAPGVEIIDDWEALGQRTTGSGTVKLHDVAVTDEWITPFSAEFEGPTTYGAFAQLLHSAIDTGIARRALDDAGAFVRAKSRPYPDAITLYAIESAAEDPVIVRAFGEMELAVRGAEALVATAARAIDAAEADLAEASVAEASLAVAAARASSTQVSVDVASRLFEVAGTRASLAGPDGPGLDRHWRNARVHSIHDPAAWKIQHLGRWAAAGTPPVQHGQL